MVFNPQNVLVTLIVLLSFHNISYGQVGINTTSPRTTLEVAGDSEITNNIDVGTVRPLTDNEDHTFLIQNSSDRIKRLNVSNPTGDALGYIQEYVIDNMYFDWISDFDTGIDATDYVLVVISANFDDDLDLPNYSSLSDNFSLPFTATFISGGTWHITANYPVAGNFESSNIGSWSISTLIFSKDLSKQLGTVTIPMANGTTGSATTPIID